jgi:hypothetical protein
VRVQNASPVETKALRGLIAEVARREGYDYPGYLKKLRVEVKAGRSWTHGCANCPPAMYHELHPARITLYVSRRTRPQTLAAVVGHEMAHTQGVLHKAMSDAVRRCLDLAWADSWPLPLRPERSKRRRGRGSRLWRSIGGSPRCAGTSGRRTAPN